MNERTQRKVRFCQNLVSIRDRVIKADGQLAGGKKAHFDVGDIDLKRAWQSMHGMCQESKPAKEALAVMSSDRVGPISAIFCLNMNAGLDDLADKVASKGACSREAALLIVKTMKSNGLDAQITIYDLRKKAGEGGPYFVRGIPFGTGMAQLVSDACMISVRANCSEEVSDIDPAIALDYLSDALTATSPNQIAQAFLNLKTIDPSMRKVGGSVTSLKGYANRIAHKYWYQKGLCPIELKETICRLVVKVANSQAIGQSDIESMIWSFDCAADLAEMVERGVPITQNLLDASHRIKACFDEVYEVHNSNYAYVSLAFAQNHETLKSSADSFADASVIVGAAKKGVDVGDPNSVIVNQPVTRKVGNATVHTGQGLASQGTLFDLIEAETVEMTKSAFDELTGN